MLQNVRLSMHSKSASRCGYSTNSFASELPQEHRLSNMLSPRNPLYLHRDVLQDLALIVDVSLVPSIIQRTRFRHRLTQRRTAPWKARPSPKMKFECWKNKVLCTSSLVSATPTMAACEFVFGGNGLVKTAFENKLPAAGRWSCFTEVPELWEAWHLVVQHIMHSGYHQNSSCRCATSRPPSGVGQGEIHITRMDTLAKASHRQQYCIQWQVHVTPEIMRSGALFLNKVFAHRKPQICTWTFQHSSFLVSYRVC